MLESIKVKNVALIDETEIELGNGLNILTGETGAGKSILIDSIHLALGAKADKSLIRKDADYAYVELCFHVDNQETIEKLREMEIYPEKDNRIWLQRRIMENKSTCRMNGETVTGSRLKEAASILIDIHGQHQHQSLLNEKKHLETLDRFCGKELLDEKEKLAGAYRDYIDLKRKYEDILKEDGNKDREISLAQFEIKEIEEANLKIGEDEELEAKFRRLDHIKIIGQQVAMAGQCIDHFDGQSAMTLLSTASKCVQEARQYDESLNEAYENLIQTEELLRDTSRMLHHYLDSLEFDGEEYAYIQNRLDTINRLKDKYGNTVEDILTYAEEKTEFLHKFEDFEQYKEQLAQDTEGAYDRLLLLCKNVSKLRKKQARELAVKMQNALIDLNFVHVSFEIEVDFDERHLGRDGMDSVRFLISLNAGEDKKPLAQVASGGELSRIMLALKSVMADKDEIDTLIFDEIDSGISGMTAWKVSEKLAILGKRHQVICITHLAQIAAMADVHFKIEKMQSEDNTRTNLIYLKKEGMIEELGRLLGSDVLTTAVLENARELKSQAEKVKQGYRNNPVL